MPRQTKNGWLFPDGVEPPPDHAWFRFPIGDKEVWGFDWNHHLEVARAYADDHFSIDSTVEYAGPGGGEAFTAAVRVEVRLDGEEYACVHGADEASNQVREPDYAFAVAESRATKRAVKKALGIVPANEETTEASEPVPDDEPDTPDVSTSSVTENAPEGVDSPPSEW